MHIRVALFYRNFVELSPKTQRLYKNPKIVNFVRNAHLKMSNLDKKMPQHNFQFHAVFSFLYMPIWISFTYLLNLAQMLYIKYDQQYGKLKFSTPFQRIYSIILEPTLMYIFSHRVVSCLPNSRVGLPGWMVAWSRRRRIFWGHQNLELVHKVNTNFPDIVGDILKTGGSTVVPVWVGKDDLPRPLGAKFFPSKSNQI